MITKKIKIKINRFNGGIMKKILLGILILCCFQELKAVTAVPVIVQRNATLEKQRNNFSGRGFVLLNKEEKINEILENNKIPKFYLETIRSSNSVEKIIENLVERYDEKIIEILYVEIIPFYDEIKAFIVFDMSDKPKEKVEEKKWYEFI